MFGRDRSIRVLVGVASLVLITACSLLSAQGQAPAPTATTAAKIAATPFASLEVRALTPTAEATASPAGPTATLSELEQMMGQIQKGTPVAEWRGVPVMPGAIDGTDGLSVYYFSTMAPPTEVAAWYRQQLGQLGWAPSWGDSAEPMVGASMLMYESKTQRAYISAQIQQGKTMVLLDITDK